MHAPCGYSNCNNSSLTGSLLPQLAQALLLLTKAPDQFWEFPGCPSQGLNPHCRLSVASSLWRPQCWPRREVLLLTCWHRPASRALQLPHCGWPAAHIFSPSCCSTEHETAAMELSLYQSSSQGLCPSATARLSLPT